MHNSRAVSLLAGLAQDTRFSIYQILAAQDDDGLPVGRIAELMGGIPGTTLSFHLKEMLYAGLLLSRQQGRHVYYAANRAALQELVAFLSATCTRRLPSDGLTQEETASP